MYSASHSMFTCSQINFTQYIGLQILEKLITTRWKSLPEGQRQGEPRYAILPDIASSTCQVFATSWLESLSRLRRMRPRCGEKRRISTSSTSHSFRYVYLRHCFLSHCPTTRIDSQTGVATQLADLHHGACGVIQDELVALRE